MEGFNITSPPLIVKDKVIVGHAGGEYRDPRVPRRLRCDRQAAVALLHDSRTRRVRQRHVEGRQLEDRRRRNVADRHLRSRARHALLADRKSGADDRSLACAETATTCSPIRSSRSIRRPAGASGTTSSRPTTGTTGTRPRTWCSSTGCGAGRTGSCCCTPIATGTSTCSIARTARSCRARRSSTRTGTRASTRRAGRCRSPDRTRARRAASSSTRTGGGATNFQAPSYSPLTGLFYLAYSEAGAQSTSAQPQAPQKRHRSTSATRRTAAVRRARGPNDPAPNAGIKALDPETGKTVWDFKLFQGSLANGVLATAGGVLFASSRDGNIIALDAKTGKHLWHYQTGGNACGVADQLRDRRPAVHRADGGQRAVQFCVTGVSARTGANR